MPVHDAVVEWFDSHCHLQRDLDGGDGSGGAAEPPGADRAGDDPGGAEPHATQLAGIVARAAEAGVSRMVCVGTNRGSSSEAIELANRTRRPTSVAVAEGVELWATIGLHPHDAVQGVETVEAVLARALADGAVGPVVVGIGECGLDYHYDHSPRPVQRQAFAEQCELAARHGLALVVHTRDAWDDTLDILAAAGPPERTVIHCFTGGPDEARRCLDLGARLSFSGVVTFKNAAEVRAAAELCPLDRLLVETDAPFLAPVPHRGTVNEPSRVPLVGHVVAQVKGVEIEALAAVTTANARAVFGV